MARIIQGIAGLAGLAAVVFGLLIWFAKLDGVRNVHIVFGSIVALALLGISIGAVRTRGMRQLGGIGIVYALILPIFGLTQEQLLANNLHWLIQTAHLLVGLGALGLIGIIALRYQRTRAAASAMVPQAPAAQGGR